MRYALTFAPLVWTGPTNPAPGRARFTASWQDTLKVLDRELTFLDADPATVTLQVDAPANRVRQDGQLAANAVVNWHGVILTFTGKHGAMSYPCDTYDLGSWRNQRTQPAWQSNVRAIALGLEALRAVDRYGITNTGQQYTGFKALGTGIAKPCAMNVEDAAHFLAIHGDAPLLGGEHAIIHSSEQRDVAYRRAAKRLHPDAGGDPELFRRLNEALELLEAQHG